MKIISRFKANRNRATHGLPNDVRGCGGHWWRLACLMMAGLFLLSSAGCMEPGDVGRFRTMPVTNIILDHIGVADEQPGTFAGARGPRPSDLIPDVKEYVIGPGDVLDISIFELFSTNVEWVGRKQVSDTGRVTLPVIGTFTAAGRTELELTEDIKNMLSPEFLKDPKVSVVVTGSREKVYSISGAVAAPGRYPLTEADFRISEALAQAGGIPQAHCDYAFVIRSVNNPSEQLSKDVYRIPSQQVLDPFGSIYQAPIPMDGSDELDRDGTVAQRLDPRGDELALPSREMKLFGRSYRKGESDSVAAEGTEPFQTVPFGATEEAVPFGATDENVPFGYEEGGSDPENPFSTRFRNPDDTIPMGAVPEDAPFGAQPREPVPYGANPEDMPIGAETDSSIPVGSTEDDSQFRIQSSLEPTFFSELEPTYMLTDIEMQSLSDLKGDYDPTMSPADEMGRGAVDTEELDSDFDVTGGPLVAQADDRKALKAVREGSRFRLAPAEGMNQSMPQRMEIGGGVEPMSDESYYELGLNGQLQEVIKVSLKALRGGDLSQNIVIQPGDDIQVPFNSTGIFHVMGQVARPGPYSLTGDRLTVKQAIATAGPMTALAWPSRCDIVRRIGENKEVTYRINLEKLFEGTAPDLYLKSNDIINVGSHPVARWIAVIRQSFRMTYGFGFVYDRNFADVDFGN